MLEESLPSFLRIGDNEDAFSGHFRQGHSALFDVGATRSRPEPEKSGNRQSPILVGCLARIRASATIEDVVECSGSLHGSCLPSSLLALVASIREGPEVSSRSSGRAER
jgi:hypothetical protein